jgi:hypothetical protein
MSTDGFSNELGRGAYGTVFKGVLTNINKDIAVKRLERMAENGGERVPAGSACNCTNTPP